MAWDGYRVSSAGVTESSPLPIDPNSRTGLGARAVAGSRQKNAKPKMHNTKSSERNPRLHIQR
jgi:hypothetical protein